MARRRHRNFTCSPGCAIEATLTLIDGKWKGLVLHHLLEGALRFNELRRRIPNVTQRMLTTQLRELEQDGLLVRTVYAEVPPRVDYRLSDLGHSLEPVLLALKVWADEHVDFSTGRPDLVARRTPSDTGAGSGQHRADERTIAVTLKPVHRPAQPRRRTYA